MDIWDVFQKSLIAPVVCESIQEVIGFETLWEAVDLDHVGKRLRADAHILIRGVVILNVLNGNSYGLFQMCLDLTRQTQN